MKKGDTAWVFKAGKSFRTGKPTIDIVEVEIMSMGKDRAVVRPKDRDYGGNESPAALHATRADARDAAIKSLVEGAKAREKEASELRALAETLVSEKLSGA